jgi:hypothetical protein
MVLISGSFDLWAIFIEYCWAKKIANEKQKQAKEIFQNFSLLKKDMRIKSP